MTGLPGTEGSRVVLIGVPKYREDVFPDVPGIANNVTELRRLFTDPDLWGLPPEHVEHVNELAGASEVLDRIHTAASAATEALVVYFAGHGLADRDGLRLMLSGSVPDRRWTGLPYRDIRDLLLDHGSQARWKTVILDCCFAGAAFDGTLSAADRFTSLAAVRGTCLLTACGETEFAWAPPGERHTAFSGELIRLLGQGVVDGPEYLDVETIYQRARDGLRAIGGPIPQRRVHEDGGLAVLGRNRAWRAGAEPSPILRRRPYPLRQVAGSHIRVKPGGCRVVVGDTAVYETAEAVVGIDMRSGYLSWYRELRGGEVAAVNDLVQFLTPAGTVLADAVTGHERFTWTGERLGVASYATPDVTVLAELGDDIEAILGLSSRDGTRLWTCEEYLDPWHGFLHAGGTDYLLADDVAGRPSALDLGTGGVRQIDVPPGASTAVSADGAVWALVGGSLTLVSIVDDRELLHVDASRVAALPGLSRLLSMRDLTPAPGLSDFSTLIARPFVIAADGEERVSALWRTRTGLWSIPIGSPDDVIDVYPGRRALLAARPDGEPVTRVHDGEGRGLYSVDRHFRRVDDTVAISAPTGRRANGRDTTLARIGLLDVLTGDVSDLGVVETMGMCVWSRTHLAVPAPDGIRIWRYRD